MKYSLLGTLCTNQWFPVYQHRIWRCSDLPPTHPYASTYNETQRFGSAPEFLDQGQPSNIGHFESVQRKKLQIYCESSFSPFEADAPGLGRSDFPFPKSETIILDDGDLLLVH